MQPVTNTILFTPRDLADRWKISPKTLERWRMQGIGPAYYKIGGRVLYGLDQIEDHEFVRTRLSTKCSLRAELNGQGYA
jgi:DNA-binding transcriptional MerR regulator